MFQLWCDLHNDLHNEVAARHVRCALKVFQTCSRGTSIVFNRSFNQDLWCFRIVLEMIQTWSAGVSEVFSMYFRRFLEVLWTCSQRPSKFCTWAVNISGRPVSCKWRICMIFQGRCWDHNNKKRSTLSGFRISSLRLLVSASEKF